MRNSFTLLLILVLVLLLTAIGTAETGTKVVFENTNCDGLTLNYSISTELLCSILGKTEAEINALDSNGMVEAAALLDAELCVENLVPDESPFDIYLDEEINGWMISGYNGEETELTIPATINGHVIVGICENAFYDNTELTKVTIESGIKMIDCGAFSYCSSLREINLPNTLQIIEEWAFNYCSSLTSITIPESVDYIASYAFAYCDSLTSVDIPSQIFLKIDVLSAFYNTPWIESGKIKTDDFIVFNGIITQYLGSDTDVVIPADQGFTGIGARAFEERRFIKSVTIPEGVVVINNEAFLNCISLTTVSFPSTLRKIGIGAFSSSGLSSLNLPENLTEIGSYAFIETPLQSVTIPSGIDTLGCEIFYSCKNLTTVVFEGDVIPSNTFSECTALTSVTVSDNLKKIEDYAFYDCRNLKPFEYPEETIVESSAFEGCPLITGEEPQPEEDPDFCYESEDGKHQYTFESYDRIEVIAVESVTALTHTATYRSTIDCYCVNCCAEGDPITETYTVTSYHDWVGTVNRCYDCGLYNSCTHDNVITYEVVRTDWDDDTCEDVRMEDWTEITDSYHTGSYSSSYSESYCPDCDSYIGSWNGYETKTETADEEPHAYRFGKCLICDHRCSHTSFNEEGQCDFCGSPEFEFFGNYNEGSLVAYNGYETKLTLPDTVLKIRELDNPYIEELYIPSATEYIVRSALNGATSLQDVYMPESDIFFSPLSFPNDITYHVYPGSRAEKLCKSYDFEYVYRFDGLDYEINSEGVLIWNGHYYKIISTACDSTLMNAISANLGAHPATVTSEDENNAIRTMLAVTADPKSKYRIGAYYSDQDNSWNWCTGEAWEYENEAQSDPESRGDNLAIISDGSWDFTLNDSDELYFIAEWDEYSESSQPDEEFPVFATYNGHTYKLVTSQSAHESAEKIAKRAGGHILTITSEGEQSFINDLIDATYPDAGNVYFWLGAEYSKDDGWRWTTGENWSYTNWIDSGIDEEPDDTFAATYSVSCSDPSKYWNTCSGDDNAFLIIEWDEYSDHALPAEITDASAGEGLSWTFENGVLTISGSGEIMDRYYSSEAPWFDIRCSIREIVLDGDITYIGNYAFYNLPALRSVTIPDTVTSIGIGAFSICTRLTNVTMPSNLINEDLLLDAFGDTPYLNSYMCSVGKEFVIDSDGWLICYYGEGGDVVIPEGVTRISADVFRSQNSIRNLTLSSTVEVIERGAFTGCTMLEHVEFNANLRSINSAGFADDGAFMNCTKLNNVVLPAGLEDLEENAFAGCASLANVELPAKFDNIETVNLVFNGTPFRISYMTGKESVFEVDEDGVLTGYTGPGLDIVIPETVKRIEDDCSGFGYNVRSVTIPATLEYLGEGTFFNQQSLTTVVFAEGSACELGAKCFGECPALTSVTLPEYLKSATMDNLNILSSVFSESPILPSLLRSVFKTDFIIDETDYSLVAYVGESSNVTIPSTVTKLYYKAFSFGAPLTHLVIPATVQEIAPRDEYPEYDPLDLHTAGPIGSGADLEFGWSEKIPSHAFDYTNLITIDIPSGITEIEDEAFSNNDNLVYITVPESVKDISEDLYQNWSGPTWIVSRRSPAEEYCKNHGIDYAYSRLISGNLDNGVEWSLSDAGTLTFTGKGAIKCDDVIKSLLPTVREIIITDGITEIKNNALETGISSAERIEIAGTVKRIGACAFSVDTSSALRSLVLHEGIEYIGSEAFNGHSGCSSLTIPSTLKVIGVSAFRSWAFDDLVLPGTLELVELYAFEDATANTLTITAGITEIGEHALPDCGSAIFTGSSAQFKEIIGNREITSSSCDVLCASYAVRLRTEYGTIDDPITSYKRGEVTLLPTASAEGCKFKGWKRSGSSELMTSIPADMTGDLTLYAVWIESMPAVFDLTLPASLTKIEEEAFLDDTDIISVKLGTKCTGIGSKAFAGCANLKAVYIPASVKTIADDAFSGCGKLTIYTTEGAPAVAWATVHGFSYSFD